MTHYNLENYQKAIGDFTKVISAEDYPPAYYFRSYSYFFLEDYQKSMADINKAISLDSTDPDYYILRALNYWIVSKHEPAIADAQKALTMYEKQGAREKIELTKEMINSIVQDMKQ